MVWRFNALSGRYNQSEDAYNDQYRDNKAFNVAASVGLELRKPITDNLSWRSGLDLGFAFSHTKSHNTYYRPSDNFYQVIDVSTRSLMPSINLVLGVNYEINENIVLGAEVLPYFGVDFKNHSRYDSEYEVESFEERIDYNTTDYRGGLSSSSVLLSAVVRF